MGTVHLGVFGTEREPIDADFVWFGATIRINPDATGLDFLGFMEVAGSVSEESIAALATPGADLDDAAAGLLGEASRLTTAFIREQIHPDDWPEYWRLAKAHRQTPEDLLGVSKWIVEQISLFPTSPQSSSAPGLSPNREGRRSKVGSSSRVKHGRKVTTVRAALSTTETPEVARALTLLQGRTDLQLAVVKRAEWRESQAG